MKMELLALALYAGWFISEMLALLAMRGADSAYVRDQRMPVLSSGNLLLSMQLACLHVVSPRDMQTRSLLMVACVLMTVGIVAYWSRRSPSNFAKPRIARPARIAPVPTNS
jgi:hypothetical protein